MMMMMMKKKKNKSSKANVELLVLMFYACLKRTRKCEVNEGQVDLSVVVILLQWRDRECGTHPLHVRVICVALFVVDALFYRLARSLQTLDELGRGHTLKGNGVDLAEEGVLVDGSLGREEAVDLLGGGGSLELLAVEQPALEGLKGVAGLDELFGYLPIAATVTLDSLAGSILLAGLL
jgi:hypothetical protein